MSPFSAFGKLAHRTCVSSARSAVTAACSGTARRSYVGSSQHANNRFLSKLHAGETIICAEGYLFEMEKRGYVQIGPFVPEVTLTHPEAVRQLHREFVRAGSDVVEAFTYYANRGKLKLIGKEDVLEKLNRAALRIAREVAEESNTLLAGNVCNTSSYNPADPATHLDVREQFREQVNWAAEEGADFIIGETFDHFGEAVIALEEIQKTGLPAVITFALANWTDGSKKGDRLLLQDDMHVVHACQQLHAMGAEVVGLNCHRGTESILEPMRAIREQCDFPLAALPVGYRCTPFHPTMQELSKPGMTYSDLDCYTATRYDWEAFTKACKDMGIQYLGTCCGAGPHHVRAIAMALGRTPEAAKLAPSLEHHFVFGSAETHKKAGTLSGTFTDKGSYSGTAAPTP